MTTGTEQYTVKIVVVHNSAMMVRGKLTPMTVMIAGLVTQMIVGMIDTMREGMTALINQRIELFVLMIEEMTDARSEWMIALEIVETSDFPTGGTKDLQVAKSWIIEMIVVQHMLRTGVTLTVPVMASLLQGLRAAVGGRALEKMLEREQHLQLIEQTCDRLPVVLLPVNHVQLTGLRLAQARDLLLCEMILEVRRADIPVPDQIDVKPHNRQKV
jgi:hypothetical protein